MIIIALVVLGLCLGSFVNALVWRLHQQEKREVSHKTKTGKHQSDHKALIAHPKTISRDELSITRGHSMCPSCHHPLSAADLVPVLSWLGLRGKCRYCKQAISIQYPLVELLTALLFVLSYLLWPQSITGSQITVFVLWLLLLPGFMALIVYDLKWYLLPNRIIYPLTGLAGLFACIEAATAPHPLVALLQTVLAVAVGGGIFYVLFQISKGKWIGGGDVKLGWLLGLVAGTPARSLLFIFLAATLGSLISLPLLTAKRLKRTSVIPFGPFLIIGLIIVQLFGADILSWYQHAFINR